MAATDHDTYLSDLTGDRRAALDGLRAAIHEEIPEAWECMSYGVPAFRVGEGRKSKVLCGYAAMKAHLGLYFFDGDLVAEFERDLSGFSTDKGTIRFTPEAPIPRPLLQRLPTRRLQHIGAAPPA